MAEVYKQLPILNTILDNSEITDKYQKTHIINLLRSNNAVHRWNLPGMTEIVALSTTEEVQ